MKKITFGILISLFLCSLSLAQNEERITISTYYPSPYGSYRELTVSDRQAIGDVNGDGRVDAGDLAVDSSGDPINRTLTVADRVGIGTRSPLSNLHIYGETPSTMAELRLDHMATTQFGLLTSWIFRSSFGRRDILGNSPNPYITIDDVGRVGIGTGDWAPPSPLVSKLTIGPTGPGIGAQVRFMPADTTAPYFYFDNLNGAMRFVTEDINTGSENTRLIVLNDGKVGIGNLTSSSIVGRLHVRAVDDADKILYVDDVTGNRLLFIYKDFVGINIAPASPPAGQFEVNLNATFLQNVRMTDDLVVNGTFNPTANRTGQGPWIPPLMLQPANPPISMCPSDTFVCGIEAIYNANSTSVQNIRAVCCN